MAGMEEFYILAQANDGRRLPLRTPDGRMTDHWLQIRSQWADSFREIKSEAERAIAEMAEKPADEVKAELERRKLDLLASLVCGWSFDQPCSPASVREFLHNAPQIAQQINKFAGDDARFFRNGSASSTSGPGQSSNSGKPRKARK